MRYGNWLAGALMAAAAFGGGTASASAANTCRTDTMTCATTMPVDGYCECTAHGVTQDGTVVAANAPRAKANATAAGCGAHPTDPGCR